jgi:GNAT superfamily N-acetyltransferase
MTEPARVRNQVSHRVTLPDGTPAVVRPIRPDGGPKLAEALRQLSPESRQRRFLYSKGSFSDKELEYFTHCDGVNHLAWVLAVTDPAGQELQPVAVARCVRDLADTALAEVAIVVGDDWQHRGVGRILIQALARSAWEVGIRRWNAVLFSDNTAMRKLLELVARKQSEQPEGDGVVGVIYSLFPPSSA